MNKFNKGDVLIGDKRSFGEAYHPIVYMDGDEFAPLAVVLTHSAKYPCNFKLPGTYDKDRSYFIAHLIEKVSEWGPYNKIGEISKEDLDFIESQISWPAITYGQYEKFTRHGCSVHPKH